MALNFRPYGEDTRNQENAQFAQQISQGVQNIGNTIAQNRAQRQAAERQALLDQYMGSAQANKTRQEEIQYGRPIDPNAMVAEPTPVLGKSSMVPEAPTGQGRNLKEMFDQFRAGGMKPAEARPEFMGALGQDERKQFYENANPKAESFSMDKLLAEKVASGELTIEDAYKMKSAGQPGTFMMGGVGANGSPVFYNNKTLEAREAPVPGGGILYPKTPAEGQMNASLFGQRAAEANQQLEEMIGKGFDPTSLTSGAQTHLPNIMQPENVQAFEQAKRNFRNAVLRKESGAAISPSEHQEAEKQYFPVAGDDPEVLKFKARNRKTAIESLGRMAGPLAAQRNNAPQPVNGGGLAPDKRARLEELRRKRDNGTIRK